MNKEEYLIQIKSRLKGFSQEDIDKHLDYFSEMIDDRVEDGLSEEEAVAQMDTPEEAVNQIIEDVPLTKMIENKITQKHKLETWQIILIVLGSPLWLGLLLGAFGILFGFLATLGGIVFAYYAVVFSLGLAGVLSVIVSVASLFVAKYTFGAFCFGAGLICIGLFLSLLLTVKTVSLAIVKAVKAVFTGIKKMINK